MQNGKDNKVVFGNGVLPCVPVVVVQQSAKNLLAFDSANGRRWLPIRIKNAVANEQGLMRSLLIIIMKIRAADVVQLVKAKADEVIEAGFLGVADVTFHDRIHAWHFDSGADDWLLCFGHEPKYIIETIRVYPVIAPDQVTEIYSLILNPPGAPAGSMGA